MQQRQDSKFRTLPWTALRFGAWLGSDGDGASPGLHLVVKRNPGKTLLREGQRGPLRSVTFKHWVLLRVISWAPAP